MGSDLPYSLQHSKLLKEKKIQIQVDGYPEKVDDQETILSLIRRFGENDKALIVELNGQFIYPLMYSRVTVSDGDIEEFINPNFGG